MNKRVITYNQVIGFHSYPDAPPSCIYLSARHRHVFVIRCKFEVLHHNREIEIYTMQKLYHHVNLVHIHAKILHNGF